MIKIEMIRGKLYWCISERDKSHWCWCCIKYRMLKYQTKWRIWLRFNSELKISSPGRSLWDGAASVRRQSFPLSNFFSKTTTLISNKFGRQQFREWGFRFVQTKGLAPLTAI